MSAEWYCTDCENDIPPPKDVGFGLRCGCGSGRVIGPAARPSPTGEKVEAEPVAWQRSNADGTWSGHFFSDRTSVPEWESWGFTSRPVYSAATIAALVVERDEARRERDLLYRKCLVNQSRITILEAERDAEVRAALEPPHE